MADESVLPRLSREEVYGVLRVCSIAGGGKGSAR